MKLLLTITRIIVGVLFIFSGLVKANDPLGLSYKMQEYFEVWGMHFLNDYSLAFALVMNVFEIVAGIAVLLGWRMKLFSWLLLLLIIFFTFLTGYAAFSGKIAACGCFGDCIPLTPIQSFWKDVILLVLILFLLINHRKIKPILSSKISVTILVISTLAVSVMQWYVLEHLPFVDCLPYKKGNDLIEQMKTPAGAIPDSFQIVYTYTKDGKKGEFDINSFPDDYDEAIYTNLERTDKLIKKGNGLKANITDFNLVTQAGNDTTQAILAQQHKYILIFANRLKRDVEKNYNVELWRSLQKKVPVYVVTSAPMQFDGIPVLKADGTVIKTAARVDPTYFVMQGAKVLGKFSYANTEEMMELLK